MMFLPNRKNNDTSIWIIFVLIQVILSIHNESNNQCDAFVIISPISKMTSSSSASIASSSSISRLYSSSAKVNENEIISSSSNSHRNNSIIDEYNRVVVKNGIEEETAWRQRRDFEKILVDEVIAETPATLSQKDQKQQLPHPINQKQKQAKVIGPNHVLIYDTTLRGMFLSCNP